MTRRERIMSVLQKHDQYGCTCESLCKGLLNDLLSLWPEPSREDVRRLIAKHHQAHSSASEWRECLIDDIMAWARGERERPIWCSHIQWHRQTATMAQYGVKEGWRVAVAGHLPTGVDEDWKLCPICGTKRPVEAS